MCNSCGWQRWEEALQDLIEDERYEWALDALEGILERVQDSRCITANMERAVENIRAAGKRERG